MYAIPVAASVSISPTPATVQVNSTVQLGSIIEDALGHLLTGTMGVHAMWTSSDTMVAKVSTYGLVTGLRNGVATITASVGLVSAKDVVTVGTGIPTATSISISPTSATVQVNSTVQLSSIIKDDIGRLLTGTMGVHAMWTSSDTTVAKVSAYGLVTGLRNGVVTITARVGLISAKDTVTVTGSQPVVQPPPTSSGTTTTPPPPPPPSTITSGTTTSTQPGSTLSGVALVSDDFTRYGGTQDLLANISKTIGGTGSSTTALYGDGWLPDLLALDNTVKYNGHATVKYNQPGGVSASPALFVHFPNNQILTTMWLRAKVRFSQGFTTTGTISGANAYKLLGWGWDTSNGRGSLEITNTNQYQSYWYVFGPTGGQTIAGGNFVTAGTVSTEWTDGQWYDYIIEYQQISATAAVSKTWIQKDGNPMTLRAITPGSGPIGSIQGVRSVMLGINFNQVRAANQTQALWLGQWEVVDGAKHANPFGIPGI